MLKTKALDEPARLAHPMTRRRVVIIGGGFGGLTAARLLHDVDVILIDRTNHHVFQPLLYQVATAGLSPGNIAWPLRTLFRSQPNVRVLMDEVQSIDRTARVIYLRDSAPIAFDALIVAPGAHPTYYGHDEWESCAPHLKTVADAVRLRERLLLAFEVAERQRAETGTQDRLTFVIVGGGPTGIELAGALHEIGRRAMRPDFPHLRLEDLSIILVEAGSRILQGFAPSLSAKALTVLQQKGITVKLNAPVTAVRADGVMVGNEWIACPNVIWAAGTKASPLLATLEVPVDESGRVKVHTDLTISGDSWIFVIGDAAHCVDAHGKPLSGIAPVAMQQGRYVAQLINQDLKSKHRSPFVYRDRGLWARIGHAQAVAQFGPFHASGCVAWALWCVVHMFFLIGRRNPIRVMSEWAWACLTFKPGARLFFAESVGQDHLPSKGHAVNPTVDDRTPFRRAA